MRKLNPEAIRLPEGFAISVAEKGLTTPINLTFTENGQMLIADAGVTSGSGKVLRRTGKGFEVVAEGFNPPLTGINYHHGNIYVSHRGFVTVVKPDGTKRDIIAGLPSFGDHHNNRVVFGPDGKMYFGQGTATNSGVVGEDNSWAKEYPFFHDYPGMSIPLRGQNFKTNEFLTETKNRVAYTGAYSAFGETTHIGETVRGRIRASGSILRANPDGSELELVAWGLRNPFRLKFDDRQRLFATNHGMDVRGSRPVENSPDEFQWIRPGTWYGWPDYTGGLPVTLRMFHPKGKPHPRFLLARHPMQPPRPIAVFPPHSATMGFDFNRNAAFGSVDDVFLAEFGSGAPLTTGGEPLPHVGHRVSRVQVNTGNVSPFAINRSGRAASETDEGGLERPIDVVFGPGGEMYIVDLGLFSGGTARPKTGVIWKVVKN
ncbi:MAG TPA: PQQ-dependent sugar dehydrogenase [Bacillales bacterium]|nr:PQQ-dependent sugar dehydrogenase [Bacillales bacterium]